MFLGEGAFGGELGGLYDIFFFARGGAAGGGVCSGVQGDFHIGVVDSPTAW